MSSNKTRQPTPRPYSTSYLNFLYRWIKQEWNLGGYGVIEATNVPSELPGYAKWELELGVSQPAAIFYMPDAFFRSGFDGRSADSRMYDESGTSSGVDYKTWRGGEG